MDKIIEGEHFIEKKIPGGKYIKISINIVDGMISGVSISGDFFVYPEHYIEDLENKLVGLSADPSEVKAKLADHNDNFDEPVDFIGLEYNDISQILVECLTKARPVANFH